MNSKPIAFIVLLIGLWSCSRHNEPKVSEEDVRKTEEAMIGANRLMLQRDKEKIMEYMRQHNLSLTPTESGLWHTTIIAGGGKQVAVNELVTLNYQVSLLDGTVCYDSKSLGVKQFRVGRGGVESGLEEGILLLREGSKAILIMPPHLAHGLTGDGNKIPARSVIVYTIEVLRTEP